MVTADPDLHGRAASLDLPFYRIMPRDGTQACWWCCHPFSVPPVGLPVNLNGMPPRESLSTYGHFCGYSCALAWAKDRRAFHKQIPLLHYLHKRTYDTFALECAPPREMLRMFGGPMSIDDFRASSAARKRFQVAEAPSLVPLRMYVEDLTQASHESTSIVQKLRKKAK